jgi:hypothetical protein
MLFEQFSSTGILRDYPNKNEGQEKRFGGKMLAAEIQFWLERRRSPQLHYF